MNAVLELGLPERKQELVREMEQTKRSPLVKPLAKLKKAIEPAKVNRNLIAHHQSYLDKDLWMVRLSELDGDKAPHGSMMGRAYIWGRRMEYQERIKEIEEILSTIFDAVFDEWQARRNKT